MNDSQPAPDDTDSAASLDPIALSAILGEKEQGGRRPSSSAPASTQNERDATIARHRKIDSELRKDADQERELPPDEAIVQMVADHKALLADPKAGAAAKFSGMTYPEDVILAVERRWRAGLMTVTAIGRLYGLQAQTIYGWASTRGWPKRAEVSRTRSAVVERVRAHFRDDQPAAAVPALSLGESVKGALSESALIETYAATVATVIEAEKAVANRAVKAGRDLLAEYEQAVRVLMATDKGSGKGHMKAVGDAATVYARLVTALAKAQDMERAAYGLEAATGKGDSPPAGDGSTPAAGSYEELVREAEARGVALT